MSSENFSAFIADIARRYPSRPRSNLENFQALLTALGSPHTRLPPVIHIAGTNGKGSTQAFLRAVLAAAGYKVHSYTSPHLVRWTERIILNNQEITQEAFIRYLHRVSNLPGNNPVSWFELITAMAFLAFSEIQADVLILETGMGGRLDATNVIQKPLAALVTPLSLDHQEALGGNLVDIAAEKAGIFKQGCPVITSHQPQEVMTVLKHHAWLKNCPVYAEGTDWKVTRKDLLFHYTFNGCRKTYPLPALLGNHQLHNAGLALATLQILSRTLRIGERAVVEGLQKVRWPGRLQLLEHHPFQTFLPEGVRLYLDGAHNEGGIRALISFIASLQDDAPAGSPLPVIIFGMLRKKEAASLLRLFHGHISALIGVTIADANAYSGEEISILANKSGIHSLAARDLNQAIRHAQKICCPGQNLIICGSLYLVGQVLAFEK